MHKVEYYIKPIIRKTKKGEHIDTDLKFIDKKTNEEIGYIFFGDKSNVKDNGAFIKSVSLDEKYRGTGLFNKMFEDAIKYMKCNNYETVYLYAIDEIANKVWKPLGFKTYDSSISMNEKIHDMKFSLSKIKPKCNSIEQSR